MFDFEGLLNVWSKNNKNRPHSTSWILPIEFFLPENIENLGFCLTSVDIITIRQMTLHAIVRTDKSYYDVCRR